MTSFNIQKLSFSRDGIKTWSEGDPRYTNWPVVYVLNGSNKVYVGESINLANCMIQHLDGGKKNDLNAMRVVLDERFNKSACLDLESYLISMFAGDGSRKVINGNGGITDADYYARESYRQNFSEIFEALRAEGLFTRSIPEIINSDLFKLSPFKALNHDQAIAVEDILDGLFTDLEEKRQSTVTIQGDPGTGKTIIAIYLMKLIRDIQNRAEFDDITTDTVFSEYFLGGYAELLDGFRIALVVPQQSLRTSIKKVFAQTPGLQTHMVLTPFDVGESTSDFDLLIVDETHRLSHRANQPSAVQNRRFCEINERLFGYDDKSKTQLDWIFEKSRHQLFLVDPAQSVRPADLPEVTLQALIDSTSKRERHYRLASQMRIKVAGDDYVGYVRDVLAGRDTAVKSFDGYDLRFFDDLRVMYSEILERNSEVGLARLVAGFAWPWQSKNDKQRTIRDIALDGLEFPWNRTATDWINSPTSISEVGSIHTVQGYDLNYAGVIIGPDLRYDVDGGRLFIERASYFDVKGKENNLALGIKYTDDDLLAYITNIYAVLLTRGLRGTYVYVCDPALREYLRRYFTSRE